jgi:hypothetical protein
VVAHALLAWTGLTEVRVVGEALEYTNPQGADRVAIPTGGIAEPGARSVHEVLLIDPEAVQHRNDPWTKALRA